MKCDELIRWQDKDLTEYYEAENVDAAITELKAANKLLKEHIANGDVSRITWIDEVIELKQKLDSMTQQFSKYVVDAYNRERRLKRALYKACANWAMNARMVEIEAEPWGENHESRLWDGVYDKCIKKAEEYK